MDIVTYTTLSLQSELVWRHSENKETQHELDIYVLPFVKSKLMFIVQGSMFLWFLLKKGENTG
jgi:hypothetical protein